MRYFDQPLGPRKRVTVGDNIGVRPPS